MKKLIFFLTLLLSLTNLISQENPIYGSKVIVRKRDTSSAEFQIINSTRNVGGFLKNTGGGNTIFKIPSQSEIAALPDSLLARYTKTQSDARFKSISYIPDWLDLTGVPSNFSTTYALSNDIQDSLLNKVTRSGSYADPSWITSLNYSKLVGTVPTWNQNTTGNAATATLAANSTLWNGLTIALSTYSSGTIPTFLGYNSTNSRVEFMPPSAMQSFLGLGSNAYSSTSFMPTSGGTFTGITTHSNTYQLFTAASAQRGIIGTYNYVSGSGSDYSLGIFSEGDLFFAANGTATKKLTITTAGVNALVTLNGTVGSFSTSLTSNGVLYAYRAASDDLLEGGSIYFSGGYSSLRIGTDQSLNIDNYNGNSRINAIKILQSGATNFYSSVTAASFQKTGSSDLYFLLGGGGHVLASNYLTSINSTMITTALGFTPENLANKGVSNGYADLDATGKIPASRIDFGQTGQTFVVASQAAMLAVSSANIGALAVRTDESKNYRLIAQPASTLANWQVLLSPDAPVQSVNGFTGNVNLLTTHISEGSNYWWTAARSRAAQSLTTSGSSGAATYDNTSGILNIPTYTLSGLGGQPALSGTGFVKISGTTISYDNSTYLTSETDPTIYAWAKETTKPSYSWGEITGTVPTWNQNTTGNAATVTNGVYTTGSYANPAWISSLDYSKLTGTIPTWNQNTTGNAATATLAANSTLWNGLTIALSTYSSGTIPTFLGYNSSNSRVEFMPPSAMQSFLGLGSNAYTSTSFLPTSGGNLTGVTTVTNSYLTFNAASSQRGILGTYNYVIGGGSTDYSLGIFSEGDLFFAANGTATKKLTITTAGVNALVTLNGTVGSFSTSLTSNGVLYAYRAASDDLLEGGSIYFSGGYSSLRIGTDQSLNIDNYNGNSRINAIKILQSGATNFYSSVTAASFQKTGSSDSYFLLGGGGHVLASTYATTSSLSGYVDISNNQYEIGGNKTFLADVVVNGKLTGARILGSTASYTTTATISSTITTAFCSGNSYTLTLPSASGVTGQILTVISNSNLTGITLSGVEGTTYTLICNSSLVLVSNGTTWKIASMYQNSGACS